MSSDFVSATGKRARFSKRKRPKLSVIIPARNEEMYLPRCLASLSRQTFRDFEIIVVDNDSTDRTERVARAFGARVVKETVHGLIPARERGYREAMSDILVRTDADSVVSPTWLERIHRVFSEHDEVIAVCGGLSFPEAGVFDRFLRWFVHWGYFKVTERLRNHPTLVGGNNAILKSAWEKIDVHTDDSLVHEDIDLACHISQLGVILYRPDIIVSYSLRRWRRRFFFTFFDYFARYVRTLVLHDHRILRYKKAVVKILSQYPRRV